MALNTNNVFKKYTTKQYLIDFFLVSKACVVRIFKMATINADSIKSNPPYPNYYGSLPCLGYNHKMFSLSWQNIFESQELA